jgi:uncharacterized protein YdeI (YjbR/CyaY-like superfamily)
MANKDDQQPRLTFRKQAEWDKWLRKHHATSPGIWVQFAKQSAEIPTITHAEALETALCHGWIDGQARKLDDDYWLQKFCPRKANGIWSQINRAKALKLIEEGRMRPAGLAAIEHAKSNGRWEAAYEPPRTATVPDDLRVALDENPKAAAFFKTLNSQNRYAILFRVQTAKKAETRIARIRKFVQMLERHEKIHP